MDLPKDAKPPPLKPWKPLKPPWFRRIWGTVAHFLVPIAVSFGANFLFAWLLYAQRPQDTVNIWWLPATLAGDLAVTIFVTVGLTFVVDSFAVHGDVKNGLLESKNLPHSWNRTAGLWSRLNLYFIGLPRPSTLPLWRFLLAVLIRALALGALVFLPFWPLGVGILYGLPRIGMLNGSPVFANWPLPAIFKGTFGAVLGGTTTPWMAWMSLIRCHLWRESLNLEEEGEMIELDAVAAPEVAKLEGTKEEEMEVPEPALLRN
jgi:hypothetical protein